MGLCEVCNVEEFKYKCPRCFKKTCSLACSKQHKADESCSGKSHDPTAYIPRTDIKEADDENHESNILVQRDYNYLINMRREVEVQIDDSKRKNKRILREIYDPYMANKRQRGNSDNSSRLIRRGVSCLMLPKGMQRSLQNKSKWDNSLNQFTWTIEWVLCGDGDTVTHLTHRAKENESVVEGISKIVFNKIQTFYKIENGDGDETQAVLSREDRIALIKDYNLEFYIKWFPYNTTEMSDSRNLIRIDAVNSTLGDVFKNRTVIEFPTIFITKSAQELPKGFKVMIEEKGSALGAEENSRVNVAGSGSSSDTETDDSDAEPEEESSKQDNTQNKNVVVENVSEATAIVDKDTSDEEDDDYNPGVSLDFLMS